MDWTQIPAGKLHAAEQRLRVALGDEASNVVERINADTSFADLVAGKIIIMVQEIADKQSSSLNPQWLRSREIMAKNFFGVEEAIRCFGVSPSRVQLAVLSEIPFSESTLEQSKDTHVLVAVFPLSILDIRSNVQDKGLFYSQDWYDKQAFAKECGEVSWQLVRKTLVDNSTSKNWQEQQALLSKDDEVPTSQVMVYTIIGHYLATGERLFEHIYVRTSSVDSDGRRVDVGSFDSGGLRVNAYWGGCRNDVLGVSSARKF